MTNSEPLRNGPIRIDTADGCRLDGACLMPKEAPVGGVVVAHPHPLYGGDRDHPVVRALTSAFAARGFVAVSFDFRGTRASTGTHDKGVGEVGDVEAALTTIAAGLADGQPVVAAGYSFGAAMALRARHPRITHRVAVAAPTSMMAADPTREPTLLVVPRHDQYTTPEQAGAATASWSPPPHIEVIERADHFLAGSAEDVAERAVRWVSASLA